MNEQTQKVVGHFDIPEELAKELSELLLKQSIRERVLTQIAISQPEKFDEVEGALIPISSRIEAIKVKITKEYVPEAYRSPRYVWNYNGWEIDKNSLEIVENVI